MKKLLALLLVLAMVFSVMTVMTACSEGTGTSAADKADKDDDDKKDDSSDKDDADKDDTADKDDDKEEDPDEEVSLVGSWEGQLDMADAFNMMFEQMLGEDTAKYLKVGSFKVGLVFTFEEDNEYTMGLNEDDFDEAVDDLIDDFVDGMTEYLEDNGSSVSDFEAIQGVSLEEYIEDEFASSVSISDFEEDGDYTLDGNKLYMDEEDEYFTIKLTSKTFEMLAYSGDDDEGMFELLFEGVEFKKLKSSKPVKPDTDEKDETTNALVGSWEGDIDMADMMNMLYEMMLGEDMAKYLKISTFEVGTTYTFKANGKYTMTMDEKDFEDALDDLVDEWVDGMTKYIEDNDATVKDFEAEMEMSLKDYIESELAGALSAADFSTEGEYKLDGNKLYMDEEDEYYDIELTKTTFKLLDYTGEDEGMFDLVFGGVVFERQ